MLITLAAVPTILTITSNILCPFTFIFHMYHLQNTGSLYAKLHEMEKAMD